MSETEGQQVTTQETGRCEKAAHEVTHASWNHRFHESVFQMATAATIDRLAADVASIKEKVDAISPEDVRHFVECEKAWVAILEQDRDKMKDERNTAIMQREAAIRERDEARAEVARLRGELAARPAANSPEIPDSSPAASQPAGQGISPKVADTQPTGNAAPAAGWLTDEERELLALLKDTADYCSIVHSPWRCNWPYSRVSLVVNALLTRAGSPPSQTAPWWLTDEERRALSRAVHLLFSDDCDTPSAGTVQALLARAGSPPVVVVPCLPSNFYSRSEAERYRDAMDKAGVPWKETEV